MASKSTHKQPQGKRRPSAHSGVSRSYSQMYKNAAVATAPPVHAPLTKSGAKAVEAIPAVLKGSDEVDWRGEYGYVLKDLRTLGLVTLSLILAIIVVGLFL